MKGIREVFDLLGWRLLVAPVGMVLLTWLAYRGIPRYISWLCAVFSHSTALGVVIIVATMAIVAMTLRFLSHVFA